MQILADQVRAVLLGTTSDFANVILYCVLDSSLRIVCLYKINLRLLSEQRTAILPLRRVFLWPVEVARKLDIAVVSFDERDAESMAEVLPDPLTLCVEVLKHRSVIVHSVVDDLQRRVEIY